MESIRIISSPESWIEQEAIDQLHQTAKLIGIDEVVGMPDLHAGRGIAIGAAFWSSTHVHPHLVGGDIGCGMGLWRTNMKFRKFSADTVERRLHGLEEIWEGDAASRLEEMGLPADLRPNALGSIGGGNHFAEILQINDIVDEKLFSESGADKAMVHLMVHSGSRGLGGAILEQHLAKHNTEGFLANDQDCKNYLTRHDQAIKWSILNRSIIAERFFDCMSTDGERLLDICHNSVTPYRDGWLHRKGAAPSDTGMIVIPGSRGDLTYIVHPKLENAEISLHSLAHGAGRKWSRTEARDKLSRRYTIEQMTRTKLGSRVICEDKQLIYEEAPQAYKNITQVVKDLVDANLIDVVATMKPLITYKTRR